MKKIIYSLIATFALFSSNTVNAQNCKAEFLVSTPQCHFILENISDSSLKYKWVVNNITYYTRELNIPVILYDTLKVCLFTEDTINNNCKDTLCRNYLGVKLTKFDYYVYKRNLILTPLSLPKDSYSTYQLSCGDNSFESSTKDNYGVMKHVYSKIGKYNIQIRQYDSFGKKVCVGDNPIKEISINDNSICRSFFVQYSDTYMKDTFLMLNSAVGENLKYQWNFGDGNFSNIRFPSHKYQNIGLKKVCLTITDTLTNCTDVYCDTINITNKNILLTIGGFSINPTKVSNVMNETNIKVFPNPSIDILNIEFKSKDSYGAKKYKILDYQGRIVLEDQLYENNIVNIKGLINGVYMLIFDDLEINVIKKIVKID